MTITRTSRVLSRKFPVGVWELKASPGECVLVEVDAEGRVTDGSVFDEALHVDHGVIQRAESIAIPALGECECGEVLELPAGNAISCVCGRLYDDSGRQLA